MGKIYLVVFALLTAGITLKAQTGQPLKKVMELKMPKTVQDEKAGTRGASVTWNPVQKKYYASFAGNVDYPMAVFDDKAKRVSPVELTAMIDTRGLWYNPVTKQICGNAYNELGWFAYTLDETGIPTDIKIDYEGLNQPDAHAAGVYSAARKQVLFLFGSRVFMYGSDAKPVDSIVIHWGRKKADGPEQDEDPMRMNEDYNSTSLVYTGIQGQELGFLNITNKQIELYDIKTGYLTKVLALPETAVVEAAFNFAYANGIYWLFNIELRKWVGYK